MAGLAYSDEASRLWRWVDSPVDSGIGTLVANLARLGEAERNALRDCLTLDDFYTLLTFARRCAVAVLRSGDASRIEPAFRAMSMIERQRIDWRDLLMASSLVRYAANRLHLPIADLVSQAAQLAEPQTAEALLSDRSARVDLASSCGYREVCTTEGAALFETGYEPFSPDADLTGIAFASALALENNGYEIENVKVASDLPLTWLNSHEGSAISKMVRNFAGCICIDGVPHADPAPRSLGAIAARIHRGGSQRERCTRGCISGREILKSSQVPNRFGIGQALRCDRSAILDGGHSAIGRRKFVGAFAYRVRTITCVRH